MVFFIERQGISMKYGQLVLRLEVEGSQAKKNMVLNWFIIISSSPVFLIPYNGNNE
jgi:hypothetical protein